ncbi:hypothetical protein K1719_016380 [Acacia pycnantha]|nr:hypothetical protein K1719_016380 [Acacia pycnantha]
MTLNDVSQTGFSGSFANEYEALMARRNALLMQQQRPSARAEEAVNHDLCLHGTGYTDPSKKIQISPKTRVMK